MKSSLSQFSFMCDTIDLPNILLFMSFLTSYILCKIFSISINRSPVHQQRLKKKAEKYLLRHQKENEEFFMSNDNDYNENRF